MSKEGRPDFSESPEGEDGDQSVDKKMTEEQKDNNNQKHEKSPEHIYTRAEISEAISNHFEKSEAVQARRQLKELLESLISKLDQEQRNKLGRLLSEKFRILKEQEKSLREIYEELITSVRAIAEVVDKGKKR